MENINNNCMYCNENKKLTDIMIYVCDLKASKVYLFKDQTYFGRVVVAAKEHYKEIYEFSDDERNAFFEDVSKVAKALTEITQADKINYGVFGDNVPHFHVHLVPKKPDAPDFGGMFKMSCSPSVTLTDREYEELICAFNKKLN